MGITRVKIRAEVRVGITTIRTPYILSFSVRKSRGQISTFDCSLKVNSSIGSLMSSTGGPVEISAGEEGRPSDIFSGIVKKVTITPCFDDPEYVIMNISGEDVMCLIQNRKFTRRCVGSKTSWVTINSVSRKGLKSGKFKYKKEPVLVVTEAELNDSSLVNIACNQAPKPFLKGEKSPASTGAAGAIIITTPQLPEEPT